MKAPALGTQLSTSPLVPWSCFQGRASMWGGGRAGMPADIPQPCRAALGDIGVTRVFACRQP